MLNIFSNKCETSNKTENIETVFKSLIDENNISYLMLSRNRSPIAMDILSKNIDKINWSSLSANTNMNAISILEKILIR